MTHCKYKINTNNIYTPKKKTKIPLYSEIDAIECITMKKPLVVMLGIGYYPGGGVLGHLIGVPTDYKTMIKLFNTLDGSVIGEIGMGNIVFLEKCKIDWCLVSSENLKGWMDKKYIWGVKEKEIIKISIFQRLEDLYWKSVNSLKKIQKRI